MGHRRKTGFDIDWTFLPPFPALFARAAAARAHLDKPLSPGPRRAPRSQVSGWYFLFHRCQNGFTVPQKGRKSVLLKATRLVAILLAALTLGMGFCQDRKSVV